MTRLENLFVMKMITWMAIGIILFRLMYQMLIKVATLLLRLCRYHERLLQVARTMVMVGRGIMFVRLAPCQKYLILQPQRQSQCSVKCGMEQILGRILFLITMAGQIIVSLLLILRQRIMVDRFLRH